MVKASSRPEVLQTIRSVAAEARLYVPDVPVCGSRLFDATFVQEHRKELEAARALLCDGESRRIFDLVLRCRLTPVHQRQSAGLFYPVAPDLRPD